MSFLLLFLNAIVLLLWNKLLQIFSWVSNEFCRRSKALLREKVSDYNNNNNNNSNNNNDNNNDNNNNNNNNDNGKAVLREKVRVTMLILSL